MDENKTEKEITLEENSAKAAEPQKDVTSVKAQESNTPAKTDEVLSNQNSKSAEAKKPQAAGNKKGAKESAKGKKAADKNAKKEKAKMQKEWEDSIVASKRVKREEIRRKVKQATIIMLVFALVVTSIVYVMLLFIQENNVRITATNKGNDAAISLSIDNKVWTPYINANGPENIWDISYSPEYAREKLDTIEDVRKMLEASSVEVGTLNGENFIRFVFMVKNTGKHDARLNYEMTLDYDHRGLQNAVRVMWGESYKSEDLSSTDLETKVDIYAARSNNPRLAGTNINLANSAEEGYIEYVAYPQKTTETQYMDLKEFEKTFSNPSNYSDAVEKGYFATTPFESEDYVFNRESILPRGDLMYCYVCIWLEGSDFECVDSALGGYVKLGINFVAS